MSRWPRRRPPRTIEMLPLAGVCAALCLAMLPLLDRLLGWVSAACFLALGTRLVLNHRARRMPSLPVKLVLFALGLGAIAATFGTLLGPEPGLNVLLVLLALKVLETDTPRDFQVVALLGFFLALCDLFFAQNLGRCLYVAGLVALLTATLTVFHRGPGRGAPVAALRLGGVLLVQALPVAALLFIFFPRGYSGYRFQFGRSILGMQGISDRLDPGAVAALAQTDTVAFRAEFPDGTMPSAQDMYWRGAVLWRGEGLIWFRGGPFSPERRVERLGGGAIRQRISLQPHGERWVFALDRPMHDLRNRTATLQPGGYLQSARPIANTFQYTILSQPDDREARVPPDHLEAALVLPLRLSPEVQALAQSFAQGAPSRRAIVAAALRHFRTEPFRYTLEPGLYGAAPLDEFLFERRSGFCDHYAAAFATLMRAAGVPARIVVGYHGGEFNALGHYVIVRQYHAHSWCEVWLSETGWSRVDPTDAIAPERVSAGLGALSEAASAERGVGDGNRRAVSRWRTASRQVGLAWDTVNYLWESHVQNYDEDQQRTLFARLGFGSLAWPAILLWSGLAAGVLLAIVGVWLRRPAQFRGNAVTRGYELLCRRLAAAGVPREPAEGPLRFTERAALAFPAHAAALRRIGQLYAALRYARTPPEPGEFTGAVRALPDLARASPE